MSHEQLKTTVYCVNNAVIIDQENENDEPDMVRIERDHIDALIESLHKAKIQLEAA